MRNSACAARRRRQHHAPEPRGCSNRDARVFRETAKLSTALAVRPTADQTATGLAHGSPTHTNVQKVCVELPAVAADVTLRISPAVQAQIIKLYLAGHNFVEIARQLHRDRRTVAKICRLPDVQAKVTELRGKLLGNADAWVDSIHFAVDHETNGQLAFKLLVAFGVIPSTPPPLMEEQVARQPIDRNLAMAEELGRMALEGGSMQPLERDELEQLACKTQPRAKAKTTIR